MWFDKLMDNCKKSLETSINFKHVFIPIFLKLILTLIIGAIVFISIIIVISTGVISGISDFTGSALTLSILLPIVAFLLFAYLTYIIIWSAIEVGSIQIYKVAINGQKPTKDIFFNAMKSYVTKLITGNLLIHFIALITSPILLIVYLLYVVLIGIPSAGWGLLFLTVVISTLFATWTIAIVNDELGAVDAIKKSFTIGIKHFKTIFLIMLSITMVSNYVITLFGPLGSIIGGWFIGGVVVTYFKIVLYLTYLDINTNKTQIT